MAVQLFHTEETTIDLDWFGVKLLRITRPTIPFTFVLAQAFRRCIRDDGVRQGFGLLQLGRRHLLYIGSHDERAHVGLAFLWLTRARP